MICKGIITDLVGQPIPKAIITIKSIRGATSITSSVYFHQCNDKGEYNFSLLKGKYKIWVQNSNFSDKNLVGVGIVESDTPDGDIDSILVAEDTQPITPSGCECTWIKKTFIPTYFYITRDSSVSDVSEEKIQDFFNNLVAAYMYTDKRERFSPLVKLDVKGDVFALPIPHVTGNNNLVLYSYSFTGVIDDSGYPEIDTPPFYNEMVLDIYANTGVLHGNKISLTLRKNVDKEYLYLSHTNTETDPTPMTFKFLETVRQCTTEEEEKPEETPKPPTPETPTPKPPTPETPDYTTPEGVIEGVLSPYTLKIKFKGTWYRDPGKFCLYSSRLPKLKEATKKVGDVVYFIFTEEEVLKLNGVDTITEFTKYKPVKEPNKESLTHNTFSFILKFFDTIMDDVVNIEDINPHDSYVPIGSAYI